MKRFPPQGAVVDCHQHLWPAPLVEALRCRRTPPMLRGWELRLPGEPAYAVEPHDHDLAHRAGTNADAAVSTALLSMSSPLGIEWMPTDEAAPLIDRWHELRHRVDGSVMRIWAAPLLAEPDSGRAELTALLDDERVCGLQMPANAISDPHGLERVAPLLVAAESANRPVLVHPGPATSPPDLPGWWPALTDYTAQMAAAWHAWLIAGRSLLPRLRIGFVALAGLAPLHHERLAQRGGQLGRIDPHVFYETSSYGPHAIDAIARIVGVDQIVHGTDHPYAAATDPALGDAFDYAITIANPQRFLHGGPS